VTLDPAALGAKAADLVFSSFQNSHQHRQDPTTGQPVPPEQAMAAYARDLSQRFQGLVGRPANGIPVFIPIPLTARDAEQQAANFDAGVFLEIPIKAVSDRLAKLQEQQRQIQEQQRAAMANAHRGSPNQAARPADAGEVAALKQKIAELEQRNQQLEAQVQLLKEMVQGKQNPAKN
jgi:hypothetical protein